MSAAKTRSSRKLSPEAAGVYVPMTPQRLRQLDADRLALGLSRGGALAAIYDRFGQSIVTDSVTMSAADEAGAKAVQPLVNALPPLCEAWTRRALERQRIGVHTNQIAKLANLLRLMALNGKPVPQGDVERIASACEAVQSSIAAQAAAEMQDQAEIAAVRALTKPKRRGW